MSDKKYEIYINGKPFEVSKEVYTFLKRSNWREEYYTIKRKRATVILDEESSTIIVKPSRELSLDRLEEIGEQIPDTTEPMDERVIRKLWIENALSKLTVKERFIISEIYLYGSTEKEVAEMSRAGCPYDNAPMERYFNTLKSELIYQHTYASESKLFSDIDDYVLLWYNSVRPHSFNNGLTPWQKRSA